MPRFLNLVTRFGRDERGAFAVIFGLIAVVLVALGGATVDYVSLQQSRSRAQIALDAAALALQPEIFNSSVTQEQIRLKAETLMLDRLGDEWDVDASIEASGIVIDQANGSLYLEAKMRVPTTFVRLVGVNNLNAEIRSEARRKKLALEIAFVLDNSGSMSYTGAGNNGTRQRMQFLQDAAKCASNILFYKDVVDSGDTCNPAPGAEKLDDVKVAVVPFAVFVNVGAGNRNSGWIDTTGASSISDDNFDNDDDEDRLVKSFPPTYGFPNRFDLFNAVGENWRGCVEARPHSKSGSLATAYLDTDDTLPSGGDTLFVPLFSPDLVDGFTGNSYIPDSPAICDRPTTGGATCESREVYSGCNSRMSNYNCGYQGTYQSPTGPTDFLSNQKYSNAFYGQHSDTCDCRTWTNWSSFSQTGGSGNNRTFERTRTCSGGGYIPTGLSNRELQERVCKYYAGVGTTNFSWGPNSNCTRTPILPLTNTPAAVKASIERMTPEGGTNIHEGTAWGLRVLSPTAPFTEGAPYDEATSKVMIIMTDGENTAYNLSYCGTQQTLNGNCYNSAYGFPYNSTNSKATSTSGGYIERMGKFSSATETGALGYSNANLVADMNERTLQTCANAKAQGTDITIYTIGLATDQSQQSSQATVEAMLRECASSPDKARFPQTPGALKEVFEQIANELTALRLTQ